MAFQIPPHSRYRPSQLCLLEGKHLTEVSGLLNIGDAGSLLPSTSGRFAHRRNVAPLRRGQTLNVRNGKFDNGVNVRPQPCDDGSSAELRGAFQAMLNLALTRGSFTATPCGLGPATIAAIDVVALEHPDAEATSITDAYDAFQREHCHSTGATNVDVARSSKK